LISFYLVLFDCIVIFGLDAWPASGVCGFTRCSEQNRPFRML
jgi:hypothetical protein